jgi:hypothetical protein
MNAYVYLKSEHGLWTVGFYKPDGEWYAESDHGSTEDAAKRVAYLNGGAKRPPAAQRTNRSFDQARVNEALTSWSRMIKLISTLTPKELLAAAEQEKKAETPRNDMVRRLIVRYQKLQRDAERARMLP